MRQKLAVAGAGLAAMGIAAINIVAMTTATSLWLIPLNLLPALVAIGMAGYALYALVEMMKETR